MSKICGYSCEHNKSGVCQISVCDKKLIMSDKTEVQTFTRYIDTTITELQQENQKYKEVINKAIEFTNKNWGTWCTHHIEYMTELQNILKEGKK